MKGRRGFDRHQAQHILQHSGAAHVWADVRSFNFKWIVPYETALSPRILRNPTTWVMLLFAFAPLLGDIVLTSPQQLVVSLVVYFALAWATYFYVFVAERTTELKVGLATAAFTIVIGVPFGMLLKRTPPMSLFYGMTVAQGNVERLVGSILADGLNEELLKALPVVLLAFRLGKIKKPLDGMFYGALSGLGFAVFEGYRYLAHAQNANEVVFQALVRTTSLPFLHATFTAISGYFVALAAVNRHRRAALTILGIAVAAVLHGSYDFATGIVRVAVAAFAYLLFISYVDRSQEMVEELEEAEAASLQDLTSGRGVDQDQVQNIVRQSGKAAAHVWADVRSFKFKWVVPYETALSPRILRNPSTWVMLLFGFAPLFGNTVFNNLEQLVAGLLVYFALAWAAYFYVFVAKRSTNLQVGFGVAGCAALISFPIALRLNRIPPVSWVYGMAAANDPFERLLGFVFGVGLKEEVLKALPILLLAFWTDRIKKPLDGIFYGALCGLGFAAAEGSRYISAAHNTGWVIYQTLLRTTTLPFLHATWTAISGYFIALAMVNRHRRAALCVLGIAVATALHGCYDFAAAGMIGVGIAAFVYLLLISYIDRGQDMVHALEQAERADAADARIAPGVIPAEMPAGASESILTD